MRFYWLRCTAIAGACLVLNAFAQDAELVQKRELAAKVVQANIQGVDPQKLAASTTESIKSSVVNGLRQSNPNLPAEYFDKVGAVVTREAAPAVAQTMAELLPPMLAVLADIYAQKFTLKELTELVKVYENPVVRQATSIALDSMPKLMEPMMQSMQQRTQSLAPRVAQALVREGLLPPPKP